MLPGGGVPEIKHDVDCATQHQYYPWYHRLIMQSLLDDHVVLYVGSGNMALDDPCVIRMDIKLTPHVDIVADAHALPFLPESVDYIFSLAVIEHLRNPFQAAESMYTVLKDGGYIFHDCNFVFAYHGYPHHYFNASLQGMEQLFSRFRLLRRGVAPYQMPSFALTMMLSTYLKHTKARETAEGRKWVGFLEDAIRLNSAWYDRYFDEPGAPNVAAGTSICGVKQKTPESTIISEVIVRRWKDTPELQKRFPDPVDLTDIDNILVWARNEGRKEHAEIDEFLRSLTPYHKRGPGHPWDRSYVRNTPLEQPRFGADPEAKPPSTLVLCRRCFARAAVAIPGIGPVLGRLRDALKSIVSFR
ncbi:MAG: class I SAM-dependent methyltransferase [Planctomycetota bacterium]|nr:class I SAM-dependent methyltransferase [Planctomycetota bacterium]